MNIPLLRKTLVISLLGHLTMFGIFSFSFGPQIPPAEYPGVSFYGAILKGYDLISSPVFKIKGIKEALLQRPQTPDIESKKSAYPSLSDYHYKPLAEVSLIRDKAVFNPRQEFIAFVPKRKESVVMFYPPLPYHFMFYFQDRKSAHIEIMFRLSISAGVASLEAKRKVSSGNLEVDLLSMRYLSPYLFSHQKNFTPNSWHTLKIDISPKDR